MRITEDNFSSRSCTRSNGGIPFVRIQSGNVQGEQGLVVVSNEYWLSDTEITVGLFRRFIDDKHHTGLKPEKWDGAYVFEDDWSEDLPIQKVSWYDSVMFCNWLSDQLKLDSCYEITKTIEERDPNKQYTVKLLATDGIRLPTEA